MKSPFPAPFPASRRRCAIAVAAATASLLATGCLPRVYSSGSLTVGVITFDGSDTYDTAHTPAPTAGTTTSTASATTTTAPTTPVADGSYAVGPPVDGAAITSDGADSYAVVTHHGTVTVRAPKTNRGSNLRLALVPDGTATAYTQSSCITWQGPLAVAVQPGVALRTRMAANRVRAITVTDNIVYGRRAAFNVHTIDTLRSPAMQLVGQVVLPNAVGDDPYRPAPLPWRVCARVTGRIVEVKVWSLANRSTEPAWGEAGYSGAVAVPQTWVFSGRPGAYIGHLRPGESSTYSALDVTPAAPPPAKPGG